MSKLYGLFGDVRLQIHFKHVFLSKKVAQYEIQPVVISCESIWEGEKPEFPVLYPPSQIEID